MDVPVYDNHLHLSPSGRNIAAAKEYEAAGGTGMTLVTLPYKEVQIDHGTDFMKGYEITLSLAERVRDSTGLKVNVAVGPYPVTLIWLAERFGLDDAERMMLRGMEDAATLVADGEANALGEIGRPHFPVEEKVMESSNRILLRGMELARELDCPVIIHSESEPSTYDSLGMIADEAGLPRDMVVKHSSLPYITEDENKGLTPSIPCSRSLIRESLGKGDRFMVETDFIDDPDRPEAIMAVTTVPKRIKGYLQSGGMTEEQVHRICGDMPSSLYERRR